MNIPNTVRLNGRTYGRQSTAVRVNGIYRVLGYDNIKWDEEVPTELVSGGNDGGPPIGKVLGNYGCSASIAILTDEASAFELVVLAADPTALGSLARATFQLVITAREDIRTTTIVLANCNAKKRGETIGNGGEARVMEYDLQPTTVIVDGKSMANLLPAF